MLVVMLLCTVTLALFIIIELIPIFREKKWKVFWTYLVLIIFSYVNDICNILGINVPSPHLLINKLIVLIFRLKE